MKLFTLFSAIFAYFTSMALGFAPAPMSRSLRLQVRSYGSTPPLTRTFINIGDQERERLTRDSEPGDYFKTNTDKMTDAEKLPIAIAGIAFITLPFLAGMIALYAAK